MRTAALKTSERDTLTGLANRQGFNRAVRELIDTHPDEHFILLYGDIDRFKVFNDRFGTEAGDRLLADIGAELQRWILPLGVVGRLRADHFICCMPSGKSKPEELLATLDGWLDQYPVDFAFFVSLGVYEIDDPSLDVSLMTDRALLALRAAKAGMSHVSRYVRFDESMRDSVVREQELVGEMAEALATGQFELYFQPQYQFATGQLVGAEVLARWNHPKKGLISPAEFIPVFERTGLISKLDYYMWEQACRCLRRWLDEAEPDSETRVPRLSVNLSRIDIYRDDLCDYLVGLMEEYRLPYDLLHLEITESAYSEAPEQLTNAIRTLQDAGFMVEMDDFGSGYSSLNALKDVPVDILKLDLRFLDARNDTRGGVILASVVRMARWLDLPVIAEGVESQSQALFLSSIGCDVMQGFLFSKPVECAAYERIMAQEQHGCIKMGRTRSEGDSIQMWDAESLVALIFNNYVGPAALAEYDGMQFEVVRANDGFLTMLGLPLDRFARTVEEVFGDISEEDRASFDMALAHAAGEHGVGECEVCVRGRGEEFWVHASIRLLTQEGAVSSLFVVLDEVTEVQALRGRLSAAMDGMPGGLSFYRVGSDSVTLLDFNDRSAEMLGMTREQYGSLCKNNPLSLIVPEDRWIMSAAFDELLAGSSRAEATIRVNYADGTIRWHSLSASLSYANSEFTYVVVVSIDVTSDKEKELRYRHLAEQQQQLYEAVPCGIVRHTLEDKPVVESANRAACRILGFENYTQLYAALSADVFGVMVGDGAIGVKEAIARLREGSPPIPFETQIRRPQGETGWIEGFISLTTTADERIIVQSAFNDVTKERQEGHRRELQRFTSVLCSVYDEIFEFDLACDTFTLWFSSHVDMEEKQTTSIGAALDRWFMYLSREEDRLALMAILDAYRLGTADETTKLECLVKTDGESLWFETTFMRVSETTVLCCNYDMTARKHAEDKQLSEQVGTVVSNLPAGIGVFDMDETGVYARYVSDAVCAMQGVSQADYQRTIAAHYSFAPSEKVQKFLATHPQEWFDFSTESKLKRRGEPFTARVQGRAVRLDDEVVRAYVVITDITDEVRERQERAWQNERYRILSELTHAISFDYDSGLDEVLLYIDRTGEGMQAQVIPSYLETLNDTRAGVVHPDSLETVRTMFERAREGTKNEIIEYRADYYGTGYQWYRTNLFVTHDEGGAWHLVGLIENIQMERELRVRAEHDAITGLSNYASTRDMINDALTDPHVRAHSVCAVIDLDDFKAVNDRCGHLRGDELLQQVGSVLRSNCRESDVVGRVGGDEFVVFLKNIGLDVAVRKLAAMKHAVVEVELSPECEGGALIPSISIGATATCSDDLSYRDVFSRADKALYQAKGQGKNRLRVR